MNTEALKNETIAFALATGLAPLGDCRELDREVERRARRLRRQRGAK